MQLLLMTTTVNVRTMTGNQRKSIKKQTWQQMMPVRTKITRKKGRPLRRWHHGRNIWHPIPNVRLVLHQQTLDQHCHSAHGAGVYVEIHLSKINLVFVSTNQLFMSLVTFSSIHSNTTSKWTIDTLLSEYFSQTENISSSCRFDLTFIFHILSAITTFHIIPPAWKRTCPTTDSYLPISEWSVTVSSIFHSTYYSGFNDLH